MSVVQNSLCFFVMLKSQIEFYLGKRKKTLLANIWDTLDATKDRSNLDGSMVTSA
jgi:hypothetical protein